MTFRHTIQYIFIFGILIISVFSFSHKTKAAGLITCLDASGEVAYVIDDIYSCPNGTIPSVSNTNINTNTNNTNINFNTNVSQTSPALNSYGEPVGFGQIQNNTFVKKEAIINYDPSLAYGAFVNLDPTDYKYCVLITRDLFYTSRDSSTGNEVSAIQSYLSDRGFLEYQATGYYGRATDLAIKKFQYRNEIEVTGVVDEDTRSIIKELTCTKQMVYVDKPISPGKTKTISYPKTSSASAANKPTVIPATKANTNTVSVPATKTKVATTTYVSVTPSNTNPSNQGTNTQTGDLPQNNNILSSQGGNMSLTQKNNLYFTYNTLSSRPYICINLNNTNCTNFSNYAPVTEGILKNFYEVINISGQWVFTIYNANTWGPAGSKVKVYLKENSNSSSVSVYTISVIN